MEDSSHVADPVAAIRRIQRSQQRFWRGFPLSVLLALLLIPGWAVTFSSLPPDSKLRLIAAAVGAAVVALPLRLLGRVSEWRLALWAGVAAGLAIGLGDGLFRLLAPDAPQGPWWFYAITYVFVTYFGAWTARKELAVELSQPGQSAEGVALSPLQPWEDENAIVLQEVASIFGWIATPGTLTLTSRHVWFVRKGKQEATPLIRLADVHLAEHSALRNAFSLALRDGSSHRFVVFDRDKWIVHINTRVNAARASEADRALR